jgi:hypothetical protein
MKYPWKRFWCLREGTLNIGDEGFLIDPESEHAFSLISVGGQASIIPIKAGFMGQSSENDIRKNVHSFWISFLSVDTQIHKITCSKGR